MNSGVARWALAHLDDGTWLGGDAGRRAYSYRWQFGHQNRSRSCPGGPCSPRLITAPQRRHRIGIADVSAIATPFSPAGAAMVMAASLPEAGSGPQTLYARRAPTVGRGSLECRRR